MRNSEGQLTTFPLLRIGCEMVINAEIIREELVSVVGSLDAPLQRAKNAGIPEASEALKLCAERAHKAWSNSYLGYHANVYYLRLEPPPPDAMFDPAWGLSEDMFVSRTSGEWCRWSPESLRQELFRMAGIRSIETIMKEVSVLKESASDAKEAIISSLMIYSEHKQDPLLRRIRDEVDQSEFHTMQDFLNGMLPKRGTVMSADSVAMSQGFQTPPHMQVWAQAFTIENVLTVATKVQKAAQRAAAHLDKYAAMLSPRNDKPSKIFIGHGRSLLWRELKDFLKERLGLNPDEFNRVPVAGTTTISRLETMLNGACFAFLIMTGEDEQKDSRLTARQNVIHEVGLFQGRLGFSRAIILLEDGCEEFSNIVGLSQIRFPKGKIGACFEEVRQVLEREGLLK